MAPAKRQESTYSPPPDGGYGWFVVLGSFLLQALTIGITYTFGVLFVDLLEAFDAGESTTSWIGSIQPALLYFTGIIAGPLIKKFGWRAVTICGSILSAIGFASSSLAPNIYVLYFTYGVLTGIGNGLMYVTSMVAVQHYFERRRAMATGLAVSGSGVGTLVFGILIQFLLDTMGWRWTLVVEAGIILIGVFCGALFRPLPVPKNDVNVDGDVRARDTEKTEPKAAALTESGQELGDSTSSESSVDFPDQPEDTEDGCCGCCPCACAPCKEIFDPRLWKEPTFLMTCVAIILFCFGYHVPYTYTPDRATKAYGVPKSQASLLVSIMGIANVGSRLLFGWVGDRSPSLRFYIGATVLTLGGVVSILIFLCDTYPTMIVYSVLFGAFTGCWASLFPVLVVDLLGIDIIEKSLGQCLAAGSIAFLVASPMSGWIIQETGSYDAPYIVVGSAEAVGGLIFFSIKCVEKFRQREGYEVIPETPQLPRGRRKRFFSESFS